MSAGKFIRRLLGIDPSEAPRSAAITLSDRGRQFQVVLDPGLPDDAYEQLFHLDLSCTPSGVLTWDRRSGIWRNA